MIGFPESLSSDPTSLSADWTDLDEIEREDTVCLFCEEISLTPSAICEHMKLAHRFDFVMFCQSMGKRPDWRHSLDYPQRHDGFHRSGRLWPDQIDHLH
jgi:hypothetical protein